MQSADNKKRVMIVDDDKDNLAVLRFLFESAQAEVVGIDKSLHVIESFNADMKRGERFDLIALDIRMPEINGNELARQLRQNGYKGSIIAVTAVATGAGRKSSKDSGFDYYFAKKELSRQVVEALLDK